MQVDLFDIKVGNDWKEEYNDMPEYNNVKQDEPFITATFKFRNEDDFLKFIYYIILQY